MKHKLGTRVSVVHTITNLEYEGVVEQVSEDGRNFMVMVDGPLGQRGVVFGSDGFSQDSVYALTEVPV
jgi:hypothetical protein